jgi:hypothetical protein
MPDEKNPNTVPVQGQAVLFLCNKCGSETQFPPGTPVAYCKVCNGEVGSVSGGKNVVGADAANLTISEEDKRKVRGVEEGAARRGESTDDRENF